mmetsp:Transcript_116847/g.377109  ORF Transcript_116847/g.377109 Transcript_116847/m.377109 type:complete len:260 (+) Transcript_116847:74-853(+)
MGYWEPHTSSIDFCEENYRYTPYVAELLNSIFSVPIAATGVVLWALAPPALRWRPQFILCWLTFFSVGVGSLLFHATMRRPAQALDELPMVFGNLVFIYCVNLPESPWAERLALCLTLVGLVLAVVYVVLEAYLVFCVMYGSVVVYLAARSWEMSFVSAKGRNAPLLKRLWRWGIVTYGLGFFLWLVDNAACTRLGVGHLHIAWHFFATAGTAFFVMLLMAFAADKEGAEVLLQLRGGLLPYLEVRGLRSAPADEGKAK